MGWILFMLFFTSLMIFVGVRNFERFSDEESGGVAIVVTLCFLALGTSLYYSLYYIMD